MIVSPKHALCTAAFVLAANVGSADAALVIPNSKIATGTITGQMIVINSPGTSELALSTAGAQGPNWADNSADGWRQIGTGSTDAATQGNSPWEPDGSAIKGQHRFFASSGTSPITSYTFNLADSGVALPDGAIINAVYASWTTRGVSGGIYSYTEGGPLTSATFSHIAAPAANLQINWTNNLLAVQTANFQRIFSTPITVVGGNGFLLNVARSGNTHQTDAIILDVTFPASAAIIPEPATASLGLLALGGLMMRRRRMA